MKTRLFALLFLLPATTWSSPFLVADVAVGTASCNVYMDASPKVNVLAAAGMCKYDLVALPVGAHSATMTAVDATGIWESAPSAPFAFARPAANSAPANERLSP